METCQDMITYSCYLSGFDTMKNFASHSCKAHSSSVSLLSLTTSECATCDLQVRVSPGAVKAVGGPHKVYLRAKPGSGFSQQKFLPVCGSLVGQPTQTDRCLPGIMNNNTYVFSNSRASSPHSPVRTEFMTVFLSLETF